MKTTETDLKTKRPGCIPGRGLKGPKRRWPPVRWAVGAGYLDRIAQAVRREREHQQVRLLECDSVAEHVFRCVCCGKVRGDQERREPDSEVCVWCVHEAGYWN